MDNEKIDELIKEYLVEKAAGISLERSNDCPSEAELSDYLNHSLTRQQDEKISRHVATCLYCLEQLDQGQRASRAREYKKEPGPLGRVIQRAKDIAIRTDQQTKDRICPYCHRVLPTPLEEPSSVRRREAGKPSIWLKKGRWLIGALLAFGLSFFLFLKFVALPGVEDHALWILAIFATTVAILSRNKKDTQDQP